MSIKIRIQNWWKAMTPAEKFSTIFKGIAAGAMVAGAAACRSESRKCREQLELAVGKIGDNVDIQISEEFVHNAVGEQIRNVSRDQVRKTVNTALNANWREIQEETRDRVRGAVKENYEKITDAVGDKLAKECETMYRSQIIDDIRKKATDRMEEKLDGKLDDITDQYAKNLNDMGRVYSELAKKFSGKE